MKKFLTLKWEWLRNPDNRRTLYDYMRFGVAPAVIAAGLVTPDVVNKWLLVVSSLFLFGSSTVAKNNVNKKEVVMTETPDEELGPEYETDLEEPAEYTTEPEDTDGPQDGEEGTVAKLMRENDINS